MISLRKMCQLILTISEYANCCAHGEKTEIAKEFKKADFMHVFGYFKEREKDGKMYKKFIVKSYNKIEKKEENRGA